MAIEEISKEQDGEDESIIGMMRETKKLYLPPKFLFEFIS